MKLKYDEAKTAQAAAYLIKKRGQGYMSYMKLIKLLYLADKEALTEWGQPITFDHFVAMDHGMVLSTTLNLINGELPEAEVWPRTFEPYGDHELKLVDPNIGTNKLSKAEINVLDNIFEKFGNWNRWKLRDYNHELPEWIDPQGSSIPVDITRVLESAGKTPAEIAAINQELESLSVASSLFSKK